MANYTQLSDTLGGSEGKGFITRSGQNREMFERRLPGIYSAVPE